MGNVFDIINKFIKSNDTPTYGDLLNENKSEVKTNTIKRLCTSEEYEEYQSIYQFDKNRITHENYIPIKDNYIMGTQKPGSEITISGIGTVKQIC